MGENDAGITFAGDGEPLLALETLVETVELLRVRRNGLPMRIVTSGLVGPEIAERLMGSGAVALGDEDARRETRSRQHATEAAPCRSSSVPSIYKKRDG